MLKNPSYFIKNILNDFIFANEIEFDLIGNYQYLQLKNEEKYSVVTDFIELSHISKIGCTGFDTKKHEYISLILFENHKK